MSKGFFTPKEIGQNTIQIGISKSSLPSHKQMIAGFLAGAFIAFAAEASNMAAFNLFANPDTYGLGKALAGAIFSAGLMFVLIAGGELFTGNSLISISVLEGKVKLSSMLRNWFFVYIGNFLGAVFIAYMMDKTGLFNSSGGLLGEVTVKIALYKVGLSFEKAVVLGVLCNWLVCIAVWMAFAAKDITGKVLAIFFPIWVFVASGFEHSIANMYYVPAGIFAKSQFGGSITGVDALNWGNFITKNLIPVTLGNIIGGVIFVAGVYWYMYLRKTTIIVKNSQTVESSKKLMECQR